MGHSYEEQQAKDAGKHILAMADAMGNLGSLVPLLVLALPLPPFDGPRRDVLEPVVEVTIGAAQVTIQVARAAMTRHWSEAMATASCATQASLNKLTAATTRSWEEHLPPPLPTWTATRS